MKVMYKKKIWKKGVEAELYVGKLGAKWKRHPTKIPSGGHRENKKGSNRNAYYWSLNFKLSARLGVM